MSKSMNVFLSNVINSDCPTKYRKLWIKEKELAEDAKKK
jgi:hypothetical protein